jgi:hypothetical protein
MNISREDLSGRCTPEVVLGWARPPPRTPLDLVERCNEQQKIGKIG